MWTRLKKWWIKRGLNRELRQAHSDLDFLINELLVKMPEEKKSVAELVPLIEADIGRLVKALEQV